MYPRLVEELDPQCTMFFYSEHLQISQVSRMVKVPGQLRKKKNARCLSKNHPEPPKSILENLQSHETSREKNAKNITHPNSSKTFRLYHMFFPNKIINKHGGNRKNKPIYILYTIIIIIYIYIYIVVLYYIYTKMGKKKQPPCLQHFQSNTSRLCKGTARPRVPAVPQKLGYKLLPHGWDIPAENDSFRKSHRKIRKNNIGNPPEM